MDLEAPSATDSVPRPPRRRGRRLVRIALGVFIGILVVAGGYYWNALRVAGATIDRHRVRFERERAALAARPRTRPAILEPVGAGTAEDVAARFEAAVAAVPEEERRRLPPWNYDPSEAAPDEEQDRILAAHPEPLAALAQVLHVPSAAPLPPLGADIGTDRSVAPRQEAVRWAGAAIRRAIARSDRASALRLIAEVATLGADYERRGTFVCRLVGHAVERLATGHLRDVLDRGALPVEDAQALYRTLDVLAATRPSLADSVDVERASVRGMLSMKVFAGAKAVGPGVGWRHLWSLRIWLADALEELDEDMDRIRTIVGTADGDAQRASAEADRLQEGVENPWARMAVFVMPMVIKREAQWAAGNRVDRTSLAVALRIVDTGKVPAALGELAPVYLPRVPIDPWDGKPLRYSAGPPAKVWSIGRDGHDDGGTPYEDPNSDEGPGDVVVTVGTTR